MRVMSIGLAAAAAMLAAGASGQAAPQEGGAGSCFRPDEILNSVQTSRTRMNIKTFDNRYFQIDTKGYCFIGPGNLPYVIRSTPGGAGFICKAIDMDIVGGEPGDMLPCIVDKLTPLTKEQVMALPRKEQPG